MTLSGFTQRHVTEREVAHVHANGAWDDASWEDCTFMSAIEWWRASGHPDVPATHAEGEALRDASGRATTGGSNLFDVVKAIKARYGVDVAAPIPTTGLWAALAPGTVAAVQGSMAAFPTGSSWRRWDPGFNGAHCVCVFRPDATDRVWWCDPLAPEGTYQGEWMAKDALLAYTTAFPGYALVAPVVADVKGDPMLKRKAEGWTANLAGAPFLDAPGGSRVGVFPANTALTSIGETIDGLWRLVAVSGGGGSPDPGWVYVDRNDLTPLVQGGDAAFDGAVQSLLLARKVPAPPPPPPADTTPFTQADIDAAVAAALVAQEQDINKLQSIIAAVRAALGGG